MNINHLISAINDNDTEKVKKALSYNLNLSHLDEDDEFALLHAVRNYEKNGNLEIVRLLLEHGANVEQTTTLDETMMIWAAGIGKSELVDLLLEYHANPNQVNHYQHTPLVLFPHKEKEPIEKFINSFSDLEQLYKFKEQAQYYNMDKNHQNYLLSTIGKTILKVSLEQNLEDKKRQKLNKI